MSPRPDIDPAAALSPMTASDRLAAWIARGLGFVSVACIAAMLILTAANVFGRYLLDAPIRGAEELTGFLIVATLMFGAPEAHRRGEHIAVDLIEATATPRTRWLLGQLAELAVIVVALTIAWTGWETVSFSRAFGIYSPGYMQVPMWTVQLPLVIGGIALALVAALKLVSMLGKSGLHASGRRQP